VRQLVIKVLKKKVSFVR